MNNRITDLGLPMSLDLSSSDQLAQISLEVQNGGEILIPVIDLSGPTALEESALGSLSLSTPAAASQATAIFSLSLSNNHQLTSLTIHQNSPHLPPETLQHNPFHHLHTLNLSNCPKLADFSFLRGNSLHTLNLSGCTMLTDVDLPLLCNVVELDISRCAQVETVDCLANIRDLNLSHCYRVTDVSSLGTIQSLNLSSCCRVTDVSDLATCMHLNLSNCSRIQSLNGVTSVHTLTLSHFTKELHLSWFDAVHTLRLSNCPHVVVDTESNCRPLQFHSLQLIDCTFTSDSIDVYRAFQSVSYLDITLPCVGCHDKVLRFVKNIPSLTLRFAPEVTSLIPRLELNFLPRLRTSKIGAAEGRYSKTRSFSDPSIMRFRDLVHVKKLRLIDLSGHRTLSMDGLGHIQDIVLENWESIVDTELYAQDCVRHGNEPRVSFKDCGHNVRDLSCLQHARVVDLPARREFEVNLTGLRNVQELRVPRCKRLVGLRSLKHLRKVDVSHNSLLKSRDLDNLKDAEEVNASHCPQLADVSALALATNVNVSHCPSVQDVHCLRNVHELDIRHTGVEHNMAQQRARIKDLQTVHILHV